MIRECKDYDLALLAEHFTECGDYTKDVILKELEYWRSVNKDFLVLITDTDGEVDGFLIGYRQRESLWLAQIWRKAGSSLQVCKDTLVIAKKWARDRGLTSITAETTRKEMMAMSKHGFFEYSVIVRSEL